MSKEFHVTAGDPGKTAGKGTPDGSAKKIAIIAAALFLLVGGIAAVLIVSGGDKFESQYADSNSGAAIIQVDESMTDDEIRQMLAEQSTSMRCKVWSVPAVNGDVLSIGFENDLSNKYDQAFQVIQGGEVIYESYPVAPGDFVRDVDCPDARIGSAVIEIFNVVDGTRYGNGVQCRVDIIGTDNGGGHADTVDELPPLKDKPVVSAALPPVQEGGTP